MRKLRVGGHAPKPQLRLLVAGDDFDFQAGGVLDGARQFLAVHRLARGAGGEDTNGDGLSLAGHGGEGGKRVGGSGNGFGTQAVRFVETVPKARLFALLADRPNLMPGHVGHQQLHRVGADINDSAADGFHGLSLEPLPEPEHEHLSQSQAKLFLLQPRECENARQMKRTPLYAAHQRLGGKLIEFGGWEMPVQYTSITDEHLAVRQAAGLFDISHMGEVADQRRRGRGVSESDPHE